MEIQSQVMAFQLQHCRSVLETIKTSTSLAKEVVMLRSSSCLKRKVILLMMWFRSFGTKSSSGISMFDEIIMFCHLLFLNNNDTACVMQC